MGRTDMLGFFFPLGFIRAGTVFLGRRRISSGGRAVKARKPGQTDMTDSTRERLPESGTCTTNLN